MDITGSAGASRWRFLYTGAGPSTGTNTFSEAMCILTEGASAGNVGIGTSSPTTKLQINGATFSNNSTNSAFLTAGSQYYGSIANTSGANTYSLGYSTNGSTHTSILYWNADGNLGLGVAPSAWGSYKAIEVAGVGHSIFATVGTGSEMNISCNAYYNAGFKYAYSDLASNYSQSSGKHYWYTAASGTAGNAITFTQAMTLDASGNLVVGDTSVTATSERVSIRSNSSPNLILRSTGNPSMRFYNSADNSGNSCQLNYYSGTSFSIEAIPAIPMVFLTTNAERVRISAAGGFSVGTTADPGAGAIYATGNITAYYSSDIKFKENVRDIPDALATVNAIGGKLFDWTDEYIESKGGADGYFVQKADFGVVAQDVQKVFPIAVRTREDGSLAVDYEKLGALAFAALVELTKRVEALEAK
jgi:hypothetical protein